MPKGHVLVTDRQIVEDYSSGKFLHQICKERKVGILRVRKVIRGTQ
jgi:hypothetical protein